MHIESKKISMKVLLAGLMILVFSLTACQSERTPEPTLKGSAPEGSLWDGVPEPEGAQYQTDNSVQEGGLHAYYTSDTSPGDFVNSYNQQLEASGWIIVSSGGDPSGQFGGGSSATKDTRFLKFNAGGPGGVSYIDICVWPNGEPNDNNCGQNQNNNTLKGAAPPSDDGTSGLLAGIPEPEGATYQATDSIQEGGLHAFWTTSMTPGEFVESYNQQLEANGWSIVSSGGDPFGTFGGGSTATQSERYFKFNTGGPGNGTTFIDLCVWPTQPSDNNCGQNQNHASPCLLEMMPPTASLSLGLPVELEPPQRGPRSDQRNGAARVIPGRLFISKQTPARSGRRAGVAPLVASLRRRAASGPTI